MKSYCSSFIGELIINLKNFEINKSVEWLILHFLLNLYGYTTWKSKKGTKFTFSDYEVDQLIAIVILHTLWTSKTLETFARSPKVQNIIFLKILRSSCINTFQENLKFKVQKWWKINICEFERTLNQFQIFNLEIWLIL